MVDAGILGEDEKVELIDGELLVVSPQGPDHGNTIACLHTLLARVFDGVGQVRTQLPLVSSGSSLPEPDLAVGRPDIAWEREGRHPRADETLLVVEVVVATAAEARRKQPVYAAAGAPVYWVVDVPKREVVVHRDPRADGTWGRAEAVDESGSLGLPGTELTLVVKDLLPDVS